MRSETEMNQLSAQGLNPARTTNRYLLLKQGVSLVSGLVMLSSGLFWTQAAATTNTFVIPDTASPSAPLYNRAARMYAPVRPEQRKTDLIFPLPLVAAGLHLEHALENLRRSMQIAGAMSGTVSYPSAFNFPEPTESTQIKTYKLWATYYHVYQAQNAVEGYPLLAPSGNSLGAKLSLRDWCKAALQGTVQVVKNQGVIETYNFARRGPTVQVDCSSIFPNLTGSQLKRTGKVRFKISEGPYGEGTDELFLVPYRTIAVDRTLIPIGSVIYIPAARGVKVPLPSNEIVIHDGYFYAADVGHLIEKNHIDVFLGISQRNPFSFVKSKETNTITAYLIEDATIEEFLESLHRSSSTSNTSWKVKSEKTPSRVKLKKAPHKDKRNDPDSRSPKDNRKSNERISDIFPPLSTQCPNPMSSSTRAISFLP